MKLQLQRLLLRLGDMLSAHRGATAIEYAMIAALIAALIVGVVQAIGAETGFGFGDVNNNYQQVKPDEIN